MLFFTVFFYFCSFSRPFFTCPDKVLSPGSPNYLYEGCLRTDDISFRESKPYVGIMKDTSGYLLCQVHAQLF